jgi:PmbA protein
MNKKELLDLAEWTVEKAKKNGADESSVDISNSRNVKIDFRDGQVDQLEEFTRMGLTIRVYVNNRYSSHRTNDLRAESMETFVSDVVSSTGYIGKDPYRSLPDPKYYKDLSDIDLDIYDNSYDSINTEKKIDFARKLQEYTAAQNDKIITSTSEFDDSLTRSVKVNSNGFTGFRQSTTFGASIEVTMEDPSGARPSDWDLGRVRYYKDLPSIEKMAAKAIDRTLGKLGQHKIKSGVYDMIVENRTVSRLMGRLLSPLGGRALYRKSSFLGDKIGKQIGSEKLTFIDDPFVKKGLASRPYDGEGMAVGKRAIIDKGILKSYYISTYYGKKLEIEPTGGSRSNVIIQPGTKSLDELIAGVDKGIFVTSFVGGNSNSTTGDFSTGIIGQYIKNGRIVHPVNEMNITGNLLDLMMSLDEVGNDVYRYTSWIWPSLLFRDIQFSGI